MSRFVPNDKIKFCRLVSLQKSMPILKEFGWLVYSSNFWLINYQANNKRYPTLDQMRYFKL